MKYLIDNGSNIYAQDDNTLKCSLKNGYLNIVVMYLIIDCNMLVKEQTLDYLKENNFVDIINTRDLHNSLNNKLDNDNSTNKQKSKFNITAH